MAEKPLGLSARGPEIREDETNPKWLREPIDINKANGICEKCRWYIVSGGMRTALLFRAQIHVQFLCVRRYMRNLIRYGT